MVEPKVLVTILKLVNSKHTNNHYLNKYNSLDNVLLVGQNNLLRLILTASAEFQLKITAIDLIYQYFTRTVSLS